MGSLGYRYEEIEALCWRDVVLAGVGYERRERMAWERTLLTIRPHITRPITYDELFSEAQERAEVGTEAFFERNPKVRAMLEGSRRT